MSSVTEERSTARKQRHRDHFPPNGLCVCAPCVYTATSGFAANGFSSAEARVKSEGGVSHRIPLSADSCVFLVGM